MKPTITPMLLCAALACALAPGLTAQTDAGFRTLIESRRTSRVSSSSIYSRDKLNMLRAAFSDPGKPGTLKITDAISHVEIQGSNGAEITVSSPLAIRNPDGADEDGFRRLDAVASFELVEKDNIITLKISQGGDKPALRNDFKITLPRGTNIIIETESSQSDRYVAIADTDGDVDINIKNGDIMLKNTAGAITATTTYGTITVELGRAPAKPVVLATMSYNIDLALPASTVANVRMNAKYSSGGVRTDFPEDALKIITAPGAASPETNAAPDVGERRVNERINAVREDLAKRLQARGSTTTYSALTSSAIGGKTIIGELNGGGGADIRLTTASGLITLRQVK